MWTLYNVCLLLSSSSAKERRYCENAMFFIHSCGFVDAHSLIKEYHHACIPSASTAHCNPDSRTPHRPLFVCRYTYGLALADRPLVCWLSMALGWLREAHRLFPLWRESW